MISSELEEIVEGADRVFVLRDGRTVAELPHAQATASAIMAAMAHEDAGGDRGGRPWLTRRPSPAAAPRRTFWASCAATPRSPRLIVLLVFNFLRDPAFRSACRRSTST